MIHLVFRYRRNFERASTVLANSGIKFHREVILKEIGDSHLYFFEEELQTEAQRHALTLARNLERNDRHEQHIRPLPNLAIPYD